MTDKEKAALQKTAKPAYQEPIAYPKKWEVVKPSAESAAFEKEREDERKRTAEPLEGKNWWDKPGGKPPTVKKSNPPALQAKK